MRLSRDCRVLHGVFLGVPPFFVNEVRVTAGEAELNFCQTLPTEPFPLTREREGL
jgi:hypothetical protein